MPSTQEQAMQSTFIWMQSSLSLPVVSGSRGLLRIRTAPWIHSKREWHSWILWSAYKLDNKANYFSQNIAVTCDPPPLKMSLILYFFDQMLWLLFFTAHFSAAILFEGSVYFVGKLPDSNDAWIRWTRYMWAIKLVLIDAGSSTHSLSVLLCIFGAKYFVDCLLSE